LAAFEYGADMPTASTFRTVLLQQGNNVGIVVPDEVIAELGAGKRPLVKVTVSGTYSFVYTIAVISGW
jgi:hypothetical protein